MCHHPSVLSGSFVSQPSEYISYPEGFFRQMVLVVCKGDVVVEVVLFF